MSLEVVGGICLVLVPLVEGQLMTSLVLGKYRTQFRDDVGMVHAVIVWLCLLCVYTITVHVTRKQVSAIRGGTGVRVRDDP